MARNGKPKIAVLGAGSWGTALAILLSRNGHPTALWGHLPEEVERLFTDRENRQFLPGIPFPAGVEPVNALDRALHGAAEVLVAVPSHAFREMLERVSPALGPSTGLSWATKGLEPATGRLLHEVAEDVLGERSVAMISGPSFAGEVARGLPTAIVVASRSGEHAKRIASYLYSDCFRPYTSSDIVGVEIGGAAKNVMAIGAGISDGLGFGANARAALITRGLNEIMRLGMALGGEQSTFMGLAGIGDLVLTCTDDQSRNRRMGLALARGLTSDEARREIGQEVEGVTATREIHALAGKLGVAMPITEQIFLVLYEGMNPRDAVNTLLERRQRAEFDAAY